MAGIRQKMMVSWGTKEKAQRELSGSAHMFLLTVLTVLFVSGGGYLYSVNQNAVEGYQVRALEKEINVLKQKSAELRITEADLRSLQRIEAAEGDLRMHKLEDVKYLEERGATTSGGPVALR